MCRVCRNNSAYSKNCTEGGVMERGPWNAKVTQWVSAFLQEQGKSVSKQQIRKEAEDVVGCCFCYFRSMSLPPLYRQWHAGTLPCLFSQQFTVFQNGRYCPIHPELSLGKKSECLIVKPQDWDWGDLTLISVSAEGIQGGLEQDALPFFASVLHLSSSLQSTCCSEHKLQSFL